MFYKEIDKNNREEMVSFLKNHFRYYTMNSWNKSTSYANNLKIHHLDITREQKDKLYDLLDCENVYDCITMLIEDFNYVQKKFYEAGFNGRSGGYLVLYYGDGKNIYPGRSLNQDEDWDELEMHQLVEHTEIVQDFDKLCDAIVAEAVYMADNATVKEVTYTVKKNKKVVDYEGE